MKKCTKCKETKPTSRFKKDKTRPDGASSWCKRCHAKDVKKYQLKNKEKIIKYKKKYNVKQYGITIDDYNEMYQRQGGKCWICEKKFDTLCIDHCHDTGKIRKLICQKCNSGIGFLKDNAYLAAKAFIYLYENNSKKAGKILGSGLLKGYLSKYLKYGEWNTKLD